MPELLHAGPFTVLYDNGTLRRISYGNTEVIRMIYFALRDENWTTIPFRIKHQMIESTDDTFHITFTCIHHRDNANIIEWHGTAKGTHDGTITFSIGGTVLRNFKRNRAGFCVLHPLEKTLGASLTITHPDGSTTEGRFPTLIDPENPFRNIRSFQWKADAESFTLDFEGDIFETEDQRNWSDASFKTFCTPLDRPKPVELKEGEKIFQKITFRPARKLPALPSGKDYIELRDTKEHGKLPLLGLAASTEVRQLDARHAGMLKVLSLHHYRADVTPSHGDWVAEFSRECEHALAINARLEVALHLTENFMDELLAFAQLCSQNRLRPYKALLLTEGSEVTSNTVVNAIPGFRKLLPGVLLGAGTDYNFTEVNKNRLQTSDLDFISYGLHPQEHAFDDLTIVENIEAQYHTVATARAIYPRASVHVSPVTLRRRYNPYTSNPAERARPDSERADPRHVTSFGAAWTFGSICALIRAGAEAVTYYQTVGRQGVIAEDGTTFPVYDVIDFFAGLSGNITLLHSDKPGEVQGIMLPSGELAVVNLTDKVRVVRVAVQELTLAPYETRFRRK